MNTAALPSRSRAGASEKTIKGYVHDVNDFLGWWKQTEGENLTVEYLRKDPFALNKKLIQDYVNHLEKKVEISTVLRKVSALRAFVKFLQAVKTLEHEPMHGLRLPRKAEPEPRGLTDKQRSRFEAVFQKPWLNTITKRKRTKEVEENVIRDAENRLSRDRAIVFLMLYAGPRVDETYQLNVTDIELKEKSGTLHIRKGKGYRERRTSIPSLREKPYKNGWDCASNLDWRKVRTHHSSSHSAAIKSAGATQFAQSRIWFQKPDNVPASKSWSRLTSCVTPAPSCCDRQESTLRRAQRCSVTPLRLLQNTAHLVEARSRKLLLCYTMRRLRKFVNSSLKRFKKIHINK